MRGQQGLRAVCPLPKSTIIGPYGGVACTMDEYRVVKLDCKLDLVGLLEEEVRSEVDLNHAL